MSDLDKNLEQGADNAADKDVAAATTDAAAENAAYKLAHPKDAASDNGNEEIFNFPCDFPIKVMGKADPAFPDTIMALVEQHDPTFDRSRVEIRPSSGGNYTGLTVTITAQSRAQLDQLYLALTGHPMVKIVL